MKTVSIPCVCDGCGKVGACGPKDPCPRGWYYAEQSDVYEVGGIIACSKPCIKKVKWWRHPR